jgi:hypothetical protein
MALRIRRPRVRLTLAAFMIAFASGCTEPDSWYFSGTVVDISPQGGIGPAYYKMYVVGRTSSCQDAIQAYYDDETPAYLRGRRVRSAALRVGQRVTVRIERGGSSETSCPVGIGASAIVIDAG